MRERIRSLMRIEKQAHEHSHHGYAATSGVPHAMVLTACFAKTPGDRPFGPSPLEGTVPLFLLRGERVGAAPWRKAMRRDIATWAVRFSHVRLARAASTASRPAHRDDRETPLFREAGQAHHKRGLKGGDKDARFFCSIHPGVQSVTQIGANNRWVVRSERSTLSIEHKFLPYTTIIFGDHLISK